MPHLSLLTYILLSFKTGIEGMCRRQEIHLFDKSARLACSMFTIHAAIFPLHRERTLIADIVQSTDNFFKPDLSTS